MPVWHVNFLWVFIYLFIWFLSVLLFFFSKKILRYSQYNGIYSVWNETQGWGWGEGNKIQPKTKQKQQKWKKQAVKLCRLIQLSRQYIRGVVHTRNLWTATAEVNPPLTLQTSKVMQSRLNSTNLDDIDILSKAGVSHLPGSPLT